MFKLIENTFNKSRFSYLVLLLIAIKVFLISHFQVIAIPSNTDDFHYVKLAYFYSLGKWLGPYDQYTLFKNAFYSIFLGITSKTSIPLIINLHILYGIAGMYFFQALKKMKFNENYLLALFALYLFNPMTHSADNFRTLRDPIFMILNILMLGALFNGFNYDSKKMIRIFHFFFAGIFAAFAYYTKEEGIWVIISLAIISFCYLMYHFFQFKNIKSTLNEFLIVLIAFLSFELVINYFKSINNKNYKVYWLNDNEGINEKKALGFLYNLDYEKRMNNVPVLKETRFKLYKTIPSFAELMPLEVMVFQGWSEAGMGNPGCPEPLGKICEETTHFGWAFRNALTNLGYYSSARTADKYYERLAFELENATKEGKLNYTKPHRFQKFVLYINLNTFNLSNIVEMFFKGLKYFITLEGYNADKCDSAEFSSGSQETLNITSEITNSSLKTQIDNRNNSFFNRFKINFLYIVYKVYSLFTPIIFMLSIVILILNLFLMIRNKKPSFISFMALAIFISLFFRLFMLTYLSVYGHGYFRIQYLTPIYPYIYLMGATCTLGFLENFKKIELSK